MNCPHYNLEMEARKAGYKYVIGTDEAGRGPLAGPVVAAAVYIPDEALSELIGEVNDSKKLSPKRREKLYDLIIKTCSCGVQDVGVDIIDQINILEATKLAMKIAIEQLEYYDYILVDGTVDLSQHVVCPACKVIKGDTKSVSIAAASILAKVTRDRIMMNIHNKYPIYKIDKHKGYGTKEHREMIELYGPCEFHRQKFRGVKEYL